MLRTVNALARVLGFVWLGLLAFLVAPPSAPSALPVQIACYAVLGLALLAWTVLEVSPAAAARYPAWALPALRGVIAVASGFAAGAGGGGSALVVFAFVAAMAAGVNSDLAAAVAVTAAGILAIEVSGLAFGQSYGTLLGLPAIVLAGLVIGHNWGRYRVQAEQAAALLAQREQLQAEQRRADLLDERARIAREIHDVLAHSLGALGIQIQAARSVLHKDADQASVMLAAAQQMAAEGLVETRRAVQALRTDTLPLDEELVLVTDTHAQRYHVPVSCDTGGVPAGPAPGRHARAAAHRPGGSSQRGQARRGAARGGPSRLRRRRRQAHRPQRPAPGRASPPAGGREHHQRRLRADRHARTAPAAERHPRGGTPRRPVDRDRRTTAPPA